MRVFKVEVEGRFKESPSGPVLNSRLTLLVDANSCDEAYHAGPDIAETVAVFGPKWIGFETVSATQVEFPYMLSDTTGSALRRSGE
jgi:hypothetical protein